MQKARLEDIPDESSITEKRDRSKNRFDSDETRSKRNSRHEDTLKQKNQSQENSSCESDNETETRTKKHKRRVRSDEFESDDSLPENVPSYRRKREHRSNKLKQSSKEADDESENDETTSTLNSKNNETKKRSKHSSHKSSKAHNDDDPSQRIRKKSHRTKPKDSTNINEKSLKTDQPSTSTGRHRNKGSDEENSKNSEDETTREKKFRLPLSRVSKTIKQSLRSPL